MNKSRHERIDELFFKELEDIQRKRISKEKDRPSKPKSISRITRAMIRHKDWGKIKEDIVKADLPDLID